MQDRIEGNGGDDLLISGTTAFDANEAALFAILAEWSSGRDYATRMVNLMGNGNGTRLNADYCLQANVTVFDDNSKDTLTGNAGRDWFFAQLNGDQSGVKDRITDLDSIWQNWLKRRHSKQVAGNLTQPPQELARFAAVDEFTALTAWQCGSQLALKNINFEFAMGYRLKSILPRGIGVGSVAVSNFASRNGCGHFHVTLQIGFQDCDCKNEPEKVRLKRTDRLPHRNKTMTLTIHLSPETEQTLLEQAAATGKNVATLVEQAIAEKFPAAARYHDAFLNSYTAEDEGLYDDLAG